MKEKEMKEVQMEMKEGDDKEEEEEVGYRVENRRVPLHPSSWAYSTTSSIFFPGSSSRAL